MSTIFTMHSLPEREKQRRDAHSAEICRRIVRRHEAEHITGKPRSSIYAGMADGTFPKSIKISQKSCGWLEDHLRRLNAARIAGKSKEEIKALVAEMNAEIAAVQAA